MVDSKEKEKNRPYPQHFSLPCGRRNKEDWEPISPPTPLMYKWLSYNSRGPLRFKRQD